MMKLSIAHNTLIMGEDNPLPGGFENGVGNLFPDAPLTKSGIAFSRNTAAKKQPDNYAIPWN
jgi:hypothetical protein